MIIGRRYKWIEREALQPKPVQPGEGDLSPQFMNLLARRGFHTPESRTAYLEPRVSSLTLPDQLPHVRDAAKAIANAIQGGKKVAVWGDYDADGVTASALVKDVLAAHDVQVTVHIPDREDGYGMNVAGVERLSAQGCETLVSVDCGVSSHAAISRARELGMEVIVTDHHLAPEILPSANHIVDPRMPGDTRWPCEDLAGVGVAFYVMGMVNRLLDPEWHFKMDHVLDLVALGTLSDVMQLTSDNRILVSKGLKHMGSTPRPGIAALKIAAGFNPAADLNSDQVVFGLAPRINAAGRVAHARTAFKLLTSRDWQEARELAGQLDTLNTERKSIGEKILDEARVQARGMEDEPHRAGLVLHGEDWHAGIVGIVASKIAEEYRKPTIILCGDGQILKGSGRSLGTFDLHGALAQCHELLSGFGGHKLAAGLQINRDNLAAFRDAFSLTVEKWSGGKAIYPELAVDGLLDFADASSPTFLEELRLMEPMGAGNPEPVFVSPPVSIEAIMPLGVRTDSIRLNLKDTQSGQKMCVKAWRQADHFKNASPGMTMRIAYTPRLDNYRGDKTVEAQLVDWTVPR